MAVPIEDLACATDRADAGLHKRCYGFEVTSLIALAISSLSLDSPLRRNRMPGHSKGCGCTLGSNQCPVLFAIYVVIEIHSGIEVEIWEIFFSRTITNTELKIGFVIMSEFRVSSWCILGCTMWTFALINFTISRTAVCLLKEVEALFAIEFFCFASLVTKEPLLLSAACGVVSHIDTSDCLLGV